MVRAGTIGEFRGLLTELSGKGPSGECSRAIGDVIRQAESAFYADESEQTKLPTGTNCCNASAPSLTNTETGTRAASTTTGHPAPSLAHWITKSKKPSPRLPRVGRGRRHSRNGWQPKCLPAPSSASRNGGQTAPPGSTASDPGSRQPRAWTSNSSAIEPKCG